MMKKIIFCIACVLLFCGYVKTYAAVYLFTWENTVIEIDVFTPVDKYLDLPKLKVMQAGNEISANIMYSRGDDKYTISTINTNVVGDYRLNYYAEIRGLSTDKEWKSQTTVIFRVVDKIPPEIKTSNITVELNSNVDIKSLVFVNDNYSDSKNITLSFSGQAIDSTTIGQQVVTIKAVDENDNVAFGELSVTVVDSTPPSLSVNKSEIIVAYLGDNDISGYFKAIDNYDGDISDKISFSDLVDTNVIGKQAITAYVFDQSGNEARITVEVEVVDLSVPRITLKEYFVDEDYRYAFDLNYFKGFIDEVYDQTNRLTKEDVIIDYSRFKKEIGVYEIYYSISNGTNEANATLTIYVKDLLPPQVQFVDAILELNEKFDVNKYVILEDNSQSCSIEVVQSNLNITKAGNYTVKVKVIGKNLVETLGEINVEVLEKEMLYKDYYLFYIIIGLLISYIIYTKLMAKKNKKCI